MSGRAIFLCAPPESFVPYKDTTKTLMEEAHRRGLEVVCGGHKDLVFRDGGLYIFGRSLQLLDPLSDQTSDKPNEWFAAGKPGLFPLDDAHSIWFREDPPFDAAYLHATQLIESHAPGALHINAPAGLRFANEKLSALLFPELTPRTCVAASAEQLRAFAESVGGTMVVKPIDGFGGQGIFKADVGDQNFNVILQSVTNDGSKPCIAQEFVPEVVEGDIRLLLMDGEHIGAFRRTPAKGEFRGNMMQGGSVAHVDFDATLQAIAEHVKPFLTNHGLRLVGLDIIGGKLTEINVTSPTGFQECFRLTNQRPEVLVFDTICA